MTISEIRNDLKDIKYYYAKKSLFDKAFETTNGNVILDKVAKYNSIMKFASPKIFEVYIALYVQNNTQEDFADKLCYSTQYVQLLNRKLLAFLKDNYDKEFETKGVN